MARCEESMLQIEYRDYVNEIEPIDHRRYTFIEMENKDVLSIGLRYDFQKVNSERNEILGQWGMTDGQYNLYFELNLDRDDKVASVAVRDAIVRRCLANSIKRILKEDSALIIANKFLEDSPVIIYFRSSLPYYNKVENWGLVKNYLEDDNLEFINDNKLEGDIIKLLLMPHINKHLEILYGEYKEFCLQKMNIVKVENKGIDYIYNIIVSLPIEVEQDEENVVMNFSVDREKVRMNKINKM